jgi:UDP-N-acetylmuramate dehydrogenase
LVLGDEFTKHMIADDGVMTCGAAVSLGRMVSESVSLGLSGFEFAVGIPGSLGGAVYMNAGTKEADISQSIETVTVLSARDGIKRYHTSELKWAYRNSSIPKDEIIIEASFTTKPDSKQLLSAKIETALKKRKGAQPQGMPNVGSIFKNPPGKSAGQLIERAGFKGYKVGGALVSEVHANFIVNTGGATAADVIELIKRIRKRVKEIDGIELTPEINFVGFAENEDRSKFIS